MSKLPLHQQLHWLNPEQMPASMRRLVDAIGETATLKLVEHYPGIAIKVPAKARPEHALCHILGAIAFAKLVQEAGKEVLLIPNFAVRKLRHQRAHQLQAEGKTRAEIARDLRYSERHVYNLLGQAADDRQLDMFDDSENEEAANTAAQAVNPKSTKKSASQPIRPTFGAHNPFAWPSA